MNKKLKIVILGSAYPFRGGLAAYNERLAKQFIDEGHEVEMVTFSLQYPSFLFPGKTQFASWKAPENLKIHIWLNSVNPLNWIRTGLKIKRLKPDLLIVKYWLPFMGPAFGTVARIAKYRTNIKVISILDNIIPHEKRIGDHLFSKFFVGIVDAFVAMSQSVLSDLDCFDKFKPRAFCPHPMFDNFGGLMDREEAKNEFGILNSQTCLLFFGFIRGYKGLDLALEAIGGNKLRNLNVKLLVAGEFYESQDHYMSIIERLNIEDKVVLRTEFIPDSEVYKYFSAADIVVQPYKSATQSGVTQIAYYFNKPMLVTDVGGLKEIVPHGKAGYAVQPNVIEIEDALVDFVENHRYDEFCKGVADERQKYTWDKMTKAVFSLFESLT